MEINCPVRRYVLDAELEEVGEWRVCLKMMYSSWDTTHYEGEITMNFV